MANKIQIKRGLKVSLPTLDSGELGFCTDSKQPYIGDGATNYELLTNSSYDSTSFLYATSSGTPQAKTPAEVLAVLSGQATAAFNMNTQKITGLDTPTDASDAVTKNYLDTLITAGVASKAAVIDKDLVDPPGAPTTGDRYWINGTGVNAWVSEDYNIAQWNGTSWDFTSTDEGDYAYVNDEDLFYFRTATGIDVFAAGMGDHAASHIDGTDDIQNATAAQKGLMTLAYAGKLDNITAGAEVNPDVVGQAEAEAGTATTERIWTSERVKQAIEALAGASSTTFVTLTDTPSDFTDDALKIVRVNSTPDGVEFVTFADTYLEGSPTNGEGTKAPTSEWAFDHDVATTGVHGAGSETLLNTGSTVDGGSF